MFALTLALTAGSIGATVVGDHVLEIRRHTAHVLFLYVAMAAVLAAMVLGGQLG
ncbi:MAG: hypothetical protein ABIM89_09225 [Mycobacteriales bacterium]